MLRHAIRGLIAVLILVAAGHVWAAEPPKVIAEGEWSKPVSDPLAYALRGRLVICEKSLGGDVLEFPVYVELQDVSEAIGPGMQIYCAMGDADDRPGSKSGLNCEMRDKDKKIVKHTDYPFGGQTPRSEWVKLPSEATIRLRATPFQVGRAKVMGITPDLGHLWLIPEGDPNDYFLSGTFTVAPADKDLEKDGSHIWRGELVLPPVRLKNKH